MDNYNNAHNLHNPRYYENEMDYSMEQKNSIDFQKRERQMATNRKEDSYSYDMNISAKTPGDLGENNAHLDNHKYHVDQHKPGFEEVNDCPRKAMTKPNHNYPSVNGEHYSNSYPLENGDSHIGTFDGNKNIQEYQMHDSNFNRSVDYQTEKSMNNYELSHEPTPKSAHEHMDDHTYRQETSEPNKYVYGKNKSTFEADSLNHPLGESCIKHNNIYGYFEKNKQNLVHENDYNKPNDTTYQQQKGQLHLAQKEENAYEQFNHPKQNEYLDKCQISKTSEDESNNTGYPKLSSEYCYMNNAGSKYFQDDASISSSTIRNAREDAESFREKNMSHTKIFDYVGSNKYDDDNGKVRSKKKFVDTFVPRYKNLTARETLLKHLAGNDNITILAANSMAYNSDKSVDKEGKSLPNVYPFNISDNVKITESEEQRKRCAPKLLPTNCNYVNNYAANGQSVSLSQIRHHNTSSHIFDTDEVYESNGNLLASAKEAVSASMINKANETKAATDQEITTEKQEKRKNNPMYTDLFGRKTPDTLSNVVQNEKILSATMKNNWMYHASDVKKYTEHIDEQKEGGSYESVNGFDKEKFHRKSFFVKDGYDNTKRLQEALKKGSNYALQAHLKSSFQSENEKTNIPTDVNKVETYYLMLYNLKDSLSDEDIKKIVKESGAHLVSYKPDYDLLSNMRKSTAKVCIRHNKGKQGLELLQQLFSQVQVKAVEK